MVDGLKEPCVQVQTTEGSRDMLKLELLLQTAGTGAQDIRQRVGDGEVVITFE